MTSAQKELALGTAQFGLAYGITNTRGALPDEVARDLLRSCASSGVTLLDTAAGYGDSEERLGRLLPPGSWRTVTKTAALRRERFEATDLTLFEDTFADSLRHLRRGDVHGLLVHHADDLLVPGGECLLHWLHEQRDAGQARHIGVSLYSGDQARALLERYRHTPRAFDIVQLPASLADQRLLVDGTLDRLADHGIQVHVRSLLLQGLLLADATFVEARFPGKGAWMRRLHVWCAAHGLSPLHACLSFFKSTPGIQVAVVGATGPAELTEIAQAYEAAPVRDWRDWADNDPAWVDPRRWTS